MPQSLINIDRINVQCLYLHVVIDYRHDYIYIKQSEQHITFNIAQTINRGGLRFRNGF